MPYDKESPSNRERGGEGLLSLLYESTLPRNRFQEVQRYGSHGHQHDMYHDDDGDDVSLADQSVDVAVTLLALKRHHVPGEERNARRSIEVEMEMEGRRKRL